MSISGLDHYLTTPPEEPDWIEEAEKWLKRQPQPKDEGEAAPIVIIEGLLGYIDEQ